MSVSGFCKGEKVRAPRDGRYDSIKSDGVITKVYGAYVWVLFPHPDPMQAYEQRIHASCIDRIKENT